MTPRILVIGLDAATMDLIGPWAAGGHLPALARLIDEGVTTRLLSTPNMHSASAWTSILTGLNPGRHGLFVFSDRDFATGRQVFFKGGDRAGELISSHLSRYGLSSGFLNVPMTYPAQTTGGGFMISGLDAPSLNESAFAPGELREELFRRFPDYRFTPPGLGDLMKAGRMDETVAAWLKLIDTQTQVAEYLIENRPCDFFMTVYTASDWAGHNLWNSLDGAGANSSTPNHLLSIYKALDRATAQLLNHTGAETQVYVISDHGMGPHTGASYHLAEWLEANGYMVRSGRSQTKHSIIAASRKAARSFLSASVRERVKSGIGQEGVERLQTAEKDSFYASIDWNQTVAYTEPGRHVVNINLDGRNGNGIVATGDYEKVSEQIIEALGRWLDPEGNRVVESVVRREEVYAGPFTERASDLYVHWNSGASFEDPPDEVRARGFWWSGDHRREGVLICKGPGIRSGAVRESPTVYDLVPTIMYAAGLPAPDGLDGSVIRNLFTDESWGSHMLIADSSAIQSKKVNPKLSEEEERLVEEKLRGLGYL